MKKNIITKPISGFMELKPDEQILFNKMLEKIKEAYILNGFILLDTPILERAEVILAKAGGDTEKQIYMFNKGSTDYAMRFDHTIPLARYVADKQGELNFPFKRAAIGKVYRGERPQAGRFREFYQADIDIIGNENLDLSFDAEVPSIISNIFDSLGFAEFIIRINNRKILNGFFASLGLKSETTKVMQLIDKLDKIGKNSVLDSLSIFMSTEKSEQILDFLLCDDNVETLKKLENAEIDNQEYKDGVNELKYVFEMVKALGVNEKRLKIDLTIARGLDYYTGTVYETSLTEHKDIGSICSGGRYENLASEYTNKKLPGVGISIGLTRLFDQFLKKGLISTSESSPTKVLILPMSENINIASNLANNLRKRRVPAEISYNSIPLKKRLNYANKLNIPYVIFIGEEEEKGGFFTMKILKTGEQMKVNLGEIYEIIEQEKMS